MEKRLRELLFYYCLAFFVLLSGGVILLQFYNITGSITDNFLIATTSLALTNSEFLEFNLWNNSIVVIVCLLMHCGAFLWLFFALQFANIIGQSFIFHNIKEVENNTLSVRIILRKALVFILLLEVFFAIITYAFQQNAMEGENPFVWAAFHGISVATNTGATFGLLQDTFAGAYIFQLVIACLLIAARLGYPVFFDLTNLKRLRERLINPKKNWTLQTRVSIYISSVLIILGCAVFWLSNIEFLAGQKIVSAAITVFFNVNGWQNAGFLTVVPEGLALKSLAVLLMLAGLAPGSFGTMNYGLYTNLFKSNRLRSVTLTVLSYCVIVIISGASWLSIFQSINFSKALYISVSVFAGNGFSLGNEELMAKLPNIFLLLASRIGVPVVLILAYRKFCKNEEPSALMLI